MNVFLIIAQEFEFFLKKRDSAVSLGVAHERVTVVGAVTSNLNLDVVKVVVVARASSRLGPLVAVAALPVVATVGHARFVFHDYSIHQEAALSSDFPEFCLVDL